jgi:hypothetical protein
VVWNGPWASPKWPFTTVEYISYGIFTVWNGVSQHFGWSPNFIPYEGFTCTGVEVLHTWRGNLKRRMDEDSHAG